MTSPPEHAVDALTPWPDTVAWRPVSPKLITVELIARGIAVLVLLAGLGLGWALARHWLWPARTVTIDRQMP